MNTNRKVFRKFIDANDLQEIMQTYQEICNLAGNNTYESISKTFYQENKQLFDTIEEKRKQEQYKYQYLQGKNNLIVGAGPAGLIAAIECKLHGGKSVVIEKRKSFTRNNVILLWDYSVEFLKSIGVKLIYKKFCCGGLHHIGIRRLQCVLLKIALLLGIELQYGISFLKMHYNNENKWIVEIDNEIVNSSDEEISSEISDDNSDAPDDKEDSPPLKYLQSNGKLVYIDSLFGADGLNSSVANFANFSKKTMKAKQAIGMTFNFVNSNTRDEVLLPEFGLARHLKPVWFKELQQQTSINLENIVYYRDETHYFVCTVPKTDLLHYGIAKNDFSESNLLLSSSNLNSDKLKEFTRQVATKCGLKETIQMKINHHGNEDIQLFDFTKKLAATEQIKFLYPNDDKSIENPLFISLIGDALLEPFWPQGTGANRAILSSLDSIFSLIEYFNHSNQMDKILMNASLILSQLHSSSPQKLAVILKKTNLDRIGTKTFSFDYDPSTRYKGFLLQQ